jgi:Sap, sulfolipid-1-addressing protein
MELVIALVPLMVASAIVPTQIVITILVLQLPRGRWAAFAFIAGMFTVRVVQGVVFGLLLQPTADIDDADGQPHTLVSVILLLLGVVMLAAAARQVVAGPAGDPDPDDPPPTWLTLLDRVTPAKAYLLGAGLILIAGKLWVFAIAAIAEIADAGFGLAESAVAYLAYAVGASGILLGLLLFAVLVPDRAESVLGRLHAFFIDRRREVIIAVSGTFGVLFLVKGLTGLGVL